MGRRGTQRDESGGFVEKLGWTILFGIVFGAGLITGQRLIDDQSTKPLTAFGQAGGETPDTTDSTSESENEQSEGEPVFSFYDRLANGSSEPSSKSSPEENGTDHAPADPGNPDRDDPEQSEVEKPSVANDGTGSERVAQPADAPSEKPPGEDSPGEGATVEYTLQVSAHSSMESAQSKMDRLKEIGLDPHLVSAQIPEKGTYYRVRLGTFPSTEAARRFKREIERKRGVTAFVSPR